MMPYDPDWDHVCHEVELQFSRGQRRRNRCRADLEPVVALYTKTVLVEEVNAVLGDRCRVIIVE
jgi:hypothetical protein